MENELQHASRRLAGLAARRPGFVLGVWGEPGIGKTHTALALLRGAPCQSLTVHATQALQGIVNAIPRPKKPTLWLERSIEHLGRGEQPELEALVQTLGALLAANAPIIVHVEDLHEAEAERLEVWTQLAAAVARTRGVGLIVTSRAQPPEGFEAIRRSPLNREASDALLEAEAGATLPSEALEWVFERAVGNPLYTLEFFRLLARQGFLWNDNHRWRWRQPQQETMPVTVEALIERSIHQAVTSPTVRDTLEARAVLGFEAPEALWASVSGLSLEGLCEACAELERQGAFTDANFVHPLYREVVLRGLPPDRRRNLTRQALEALEPEDPRAAAGFVSHAGLDSERALALLRRAAQVSSEARNEVQAAQFLAQAIGYATGEEKGILALKAAQGLRHTDLPQAADLAGIAVEALPGNTEGIDLLAQLLAHQGRTTEVEQTLKRLPATEQSGPPWLLRLLKLRTIMHDRAGVLELWEAHPELHPHLDPDLASDIAFALAAMNHNDDARKVATGALVKQELGANHRAKLLNVMGILCAFEGDFVRAETFFAEAVELAKRSGISQRISGALTNHASALCCLGRYREMMVEHREAMRLYGEMGDGRGYARSQSLVGVQLIESGEYEQAEEALLSSLEHLEQGAVDDFLIHCEGNLSILYHEWGLPQSPLLSLKYAHASLRHARTLGAPSRLAEGLNYAAMAEAQSSNPMTGLVLAEEALEIARRIAQPEMIYAAQRARGAALFALGQLDDALEALHEAEQLACGIGLLLEANKARLEIARLTNDAEEALKHLEWFESHG